MSNSEYDFKRNFAIVIGINKYNNLKIPLKTAVSDAKELARILTHYHGQLKDKYQEQNKYEVRLLTDEEATLEKLKQLLEDLKQGQISLNHETVKVNNNDRVIFYFAGHGKGTEPEENQDGPAGYLFPQDATDERSTWLPMKELHDALLKLSCRHMLVILDCCFGGIFRLASYKRAAKPKIKVYKETYDRFIRYPAWQVITSAGDDQEALDSFRCRETVSGTNHSPFAQALFHALQGEPDPSCQKTADTDDDHIITADELGIYLERYVDRVAEKQGHNQTPSIFSLSKHGNGRFFFLLKDFNRDKLKEAPKITPENNPYRGLESYDEEHSKLFHGRNKLIEKLTNHVIGNEKAFTVILGVSGTGKSSLMKAGLLPCLRDVHQLTILEPMRVGDSPLTALAQVLSVTDETIENWTQELKKESESFVNSIKSSEKHKNDTLLYQGIQNLKLNDNQVCFLDKWGENDSKNKEKINTWLEKLNKRKQKIEKTSQEIADDLKENTQALATIIKGWHERHPKAKLLLAVDQFEELITLAKNDNNKHQHDFQKILRETIAQCKDYFDIVITLRSDFEAQFKDGILKDFWKDTARFIVTPMTQDELREVIEKPAAEKEIMFDPPSLVEKLINEVIQMPGSLPLLSFALSELYHNYMEENNQSTRNKRALTEGDYNKIGGVFGSLTKRADEEYNALVKKDKAYEKTVRQVMLRMVAVGDEARRRVLSSELEYSDKVEHQRAQNVIQQFCQARLLVQGTNPENPENSPYVEPAHDALIQNWQRLREWKDQEKETLILQRKLTPAANDWQEINQSEKDSKTKSKFRIKYFFYCLEKVEAFFIVQAQHPIRKVKKARLAKQQSSGLSKNYLWHNDPRLAQLDLFLDSQDNWFNKTEDEFVRERSSTKGEIRIGFGFLLL